MTYRYDDESHVWLEDGYAARHADLVLILIGEFTGFRKALSAG
jgi:hypothetical protein